MFRLQMLFDSGETVGSRPVTRISASFSELPHGPCEGNDKGSHRKDFRSSITSLSDWLSTLRHACYRTQRKTRFRPLVRRYRTGFSPAGSLSKVSDSITFHLPPSPSFLAQSPFIARVPVYCSPSFLAQSPFIAPRIFRCHLVLRERNHRSMITTAVD
jgi:hypothetical protein